MLPEYITNLLHQVAKYEGFSNYKIDDKSGSNHGDNYVAVMTSAIISGTKNIDGENKNAELHLICKAAPADESRKKFLKSDLLFGREIYTFSTLLPAFIQFQKEKGLSEHESFVSFPKVYASEINSENGIYVLIMGDLRHTNYKMWPREKVISLDHELLFLKELGKFHGVSFALKDQRPSDFEEFKQLNDPFIEVVIHGLFRQFMDKSFVRAADAVKNPKYKLFLKNLRNTYAENLIDCMNNKEFAVIGHGSFIDNIQAWNLSIYSYVFVIFKGDCWTNNFMFRYTDENGKQLKSISVLDWQMTHYCSPVLDFLYNVFSATDKEFRKNHYDELLQAYYSSLSETIRKLGSDPNQLYSFENFQEQLRTFGETAIIFAPILLSVKICDLKDIRPVDEYAEFVVKGEETDLIKELDEATQSKFGTLITDIIDDLLELGYMKIE